MESGGEGIIYTCKYSVNNDEDDESTFYCLSTSAEDNRRGFFKLEPYCINYGIEHNKDGLRIIGFAESLGEEPQITISGEFEHFCLMFLLRKIYENNPRPSEEESGIEIIEANRYARDLIGCDIEEIVGDEDIETIMRPLEEEFTVKKISGKKFKVFIQ